jgi:hypothetical protein
MSIPTASTPAALLASLLAALPAAMPATMTASGASPTAGNDLYEAYLFGLVLRAARTEGFGVTFANADGSATDLRLRRAPGRLATGGPKSARFTHAVLACQPRPALEVHTGVGVVGKSKVVHEADVLVLPQSAAERCRTYDLDPGGQSAALLIEAKYYTKPVGLDTGREFLGLCSDIAAKRKVFAATVASDSVVHLFSGTSTDHDIGVLPRREAERSLVHLIRRILRGYGSRL